jgi:HPt (histidine-containing phosphotransfer) domain-containing protein
MLTIDSLKAYGANVEEGLGRCMNMEPFYLKVVGMVKDDVDGSFARLKSAMAARDAVKTFEAAHALKGSTGNVALTPIFKPVCTLSDLLKGNTDKPMSPECDRLANEVLEQYDRLKAL